LSKGWFTTSSVTSDHEWYMKIFKDPKNPSNNLVGIVWNTPHICFSSNCDHDSTWAWSIKFPGASHSVFTGEEFTKQEAIYKVEEYFKGV
jgi:hypothetical protein